MPQRKNSKLPKSPQPSQGYSPSDGYETVYPLETAQEKQPFIDRFSQLTRSSVASTSTQSSRGDEEIISEPQVRIFTVPPLAAQGISDVDVHRRRGETIGIRQREVVAGQFILPHKRWKTMSDIYGYKMTGPLYAQINSRNLARANLVEDIDSLESRAIKWTYSVTAHSLGRFIFLVDKHCTICLKPMKIYFFYNNNVGSTLCDYGRRDRDPVRPHLENNTLGFAHNSCFANIMTNGEHNFFFKLMERKLSFHEWWILRRPLLMISEIILLTTFLLGISAALLYIVFKNMVTNYTQFVAWIFGLVALSFVFIITIRFLTSSVYECRQAYGNNYQEIKFELWKDSDCILEGVDISN